MVSYQCQKCNKVFNRKSNYDYHIYKKKRPCSNGPAINLHNIEKKSAIKKKFQCTFCHKWYTRKDSLKRHQNSFCKVKISISNGTSEMHDNVVSDLSKVTKLDKFAQSKIKQTKYCPILATTKSAKLSSEIKTNSLFKCCFCGREFRHASSLSRHKKSRCPNRKIDDSNYLKEKIKNLEKELQKLKSNIPKKQIVINNNKNNSDNIINNTTNNTTNNNININLIAFGKEDLYEIDDKITIAILKKGYQSISNLIKYTHFNKNKPELHNVYISNIKNNYANIFDGQDWILQKKLEVINQLFDDSQCFLIDKYKELEDNLCEITKKKFGRFMNEDDDTVIDNLKNDIVLMLYNKRDIPINTKKKQSLLS